MSDFPDLVPPPARGLSPEQRDRIQARLTDAGAERPGRPWLLPGVAAAVVLACVGGAVAVSSSIGDDTQPRQLQPAVSSRPSPLTFTDDGGGLCLENGPRTVVMINTVTTTRAVVLAGVSLENAVGATVGRSWVAEVDSDVPAAGSFQEGVSGIRPSLGWQDRYPLESARLVPGKIYRTFFRVTFAAVGQYKGTRFSYVDDGMLGSIALNGTVRARAHCSLR